MRTGVRRGHDREGNRWCAEYKFTPAIPSFLFGASLFYFRDMHKALPRPRLCLLITSLCLVVTMVSRIPHLFVLLLVYATVRADIRWHELARDQAGLDIGRNL